VLNANGSEGSPGRGASFFILLAIKNARHRAATLGFALDVADVSAVSELDQAFHAIRLKRPDAWLVIADPLLAHERVLIATRMLEHRLPSIYAYHEHIEAGGLIAYMTDHHEIFRREAAFIDKIFKGAKPGDLPVEHGRSQHDALDALAYGIKARKINWILDADISRFFDSLSPEWLVRFSNTELAINGSSA
jgi:ABC transporter substrate binding protein